MKNRRAMKLLQNRMALIGIVLRGSSYVFRAYGDPAHAARWGRVFAVSSLVTPLVLGGLFNYWWWGQEGAKVLGTDFLRFLFRPSVRSHARN